MQRTLELTIRINENDFEVDVYEPESGEVIQIQHPLSFDEHPDFDKVIGNEIYSWLSLWAEEREEKKVNSESGNICRKTWDGLSRMSPIDYESTPDFQSDTGGGFPIVLNWTFEHNVAWLEPAPCFSGEEGFDKTELECRLWGVRRVYDESDVNSLLRSLGEDAKQLQLCEEEEK